MMGNQRCTRTRRCCAALIPFGAQVGSRLATHRCLQDAGLAGLQGRFLLPCTTKLILLLVVIKTSMCAVLRCGFLPWTVLLVRPFLAWAVS